MEPAIRGRTEENGPIQPSGPTRRLRDTADRPLFDAADWKPGDPSTAPPEDHPAVRARVEAGDIPRSTPGRAAVDMAAIGRAYAGTWVGDLIKAVYDTGHSDGESCLGHEVRTAVETSRSLPELLAALTEVTGCGAELGANLPPGQPYRPSLGH